MIKNALYNIVDTNLSLYDFVGAQDIYKLLHQGTYGCEHAVGEGAKDYFDSEYDCAMAVVDGLGNSVEPLAERISPDFMLYRINIRPYKKMIGDKDLLYDVFVETSEQKYHESSDIFLRRWKMLKDMDFYCNALPELKTFENEFKPFLKENGHLPVMHHSEDYRHINCPCYRVVDYDILAGYIEDDCKLREAIGEWVYL